MLLKDRRPNPGFILGAGLLLAAGCARLPAPRARLLLVGPAERSWVERTLKSLSLEEKVGQMVVWQYSGLFRNADSAYLKDLEALVVGHRLGGLILTRGEVYETALLTNALQRMARVPLLIASDLEQGAGVKVTEATLFPPLMALGAAGSDELAYEMGRITALEGRAVGIHMAYAPVVDVNVNPENPIINTRSPGEAPDLVSRISGAFIRGCQDNGMIATAKHFPGHGDTAQDSHSLLPAISGDVERLNRVELYPFKQAVEAGVQAVMTAHLFVPALDPTPGLPATLSPAVLTGLLRKEMGFRGLIVTDAMNMGGVANAFSPEEAALKAVLAGVDQVLLPPQPAKVAAFLVEAARDGRIPAARIEESVRRILEAKARLGLHKRRFVKIEDLTRKIAPRAHLEQAMKTFEKAATLVKNEGGILPLKPGLKLAVFSLGSDPGDYFAGQEFVNQLRKRVSSVMAFYADGDTGQESLDKAAAPAMSADVLVFALFSRLGAWKGSVDLQPGHAALIRRMAEEKGAGSIIVVSFGSPYFLRHFPEVGAYLCLYKNTPPAQEVAARALAGEMDILGRLPVSLPGLYPLGHGIELLRNGRD